MVGARTFPGNPYDGHLLHAQLEQTTILLEPHAVAPTQVLVDLGFRGVDADNPEVEIIHRGKYSSLSRTQRRWLRRRQAVEPAIGHLKQDYRMDRCGLQGALGHALYAVLCAAGFNLRWLIRAVLRRRIKPLFWPWWLRAWLRDALPAPSVAPSRPRFRCPELSLPPTAWAGANQTLSHVA